MTTSNAARAAMLDTIREMLVEVYDKITDLEPLTPDDDRLALQVSIAVQDLAIRVRQRIVALS